MGLSFSGDYFKDDEYNLNLVKHFKSPKASIEIENIAKRIVEDFAPKTVLDCGCVDGLLVLKLRELGVDAYGVSSSRNILENLNEKAVNYCFSESAFLESGKDLIKKYDLIVCIQDVDFVKRLDFKDYIFKLSDISANVLFGCILNEDQKSVDLPFISAVFGKNGMFRDLKYYLNFLDSKIYLFSKIDESVVYKTIGEYEKIVGRKEKEIKKLRKERDSLDKKVLIYSKNFFIFKNMRNKYFEMECLIKDLRIQIKVLREFEKRYVQIKESFFWNLTWPGRFTVTCIRRFFKLCRRILFFTLKNLKPKNFKSNLVLFLKFGLRAFIKQKIMHQPISNTIVEFRKYFKMIKPTAKELELQRGVKFKDSVVFSIIVPVYNTPEKFLVDMIKSVQAQTYPNWQLCLADGSEGEKYSYIEQLCEQFQKKDSRIVYKKLGKNFGIAENSNEALKMATGEYIGLLDHDDILSPTALFENVKVINKEKPDFIYSDEMTFEKNNIDFVSFMHFKPDYSPDTLCASNYICHFSVFSAELCKEVGFFSSEHDGSQDYDYILRLTEKAKKIYHIPKVLYYWRASEFSVAKDPTIKPYCVDAGRRAVKDHITRLGRKGTVVDGLHFTLYRVNYEIIGNPKISILIPNKDHILDLQTCVQSVLERSTYQNFEIIIIENGSNFETLDYYKILQKKDPRIKVVYYKGNFNYSAINNFGAKYATGEYYLFLNNDTEVITANWVEEMLMYAQRDDVGAVGAKLYYKDDTIQHAGVFLRIGGIGGHGHKCIPKSSLGYAGRAGIVQNVSAVTGACCLVKKKAFFSVGGFDEDLRVSFNDVDFCLRLREHGYLNVFTPYAELYHYESKSRGYADTPEKYAELSFEVDFMYKRWALVFKKGDPYYNPNLTLADETFRVKLED